jgi:hypothetical protein
MTEREVLAEIGEALYGPSWKLPMASDLEVDDRSLRRWIQTGQIPKGVWKELAESLNKKNSEIKKLMTAAISFM